MPGPGKNYPRRSDVVDRQIALMEKRRKDDISYLPPTGEGSFAYASGDEFRHDGDIFPIFHDITAQTGEYTPSSAGLDLTEPDYNAYQLDGSEGLWETHLSAVWFFWITGPSQNLIPPTSFPGIPHWARIPVNPALSRSPEGEQITVDRPINPAYDILVPLTSTSGVAPPDYAYAFELPYRWTVTNGGDPHGKVYYGFGLPTLYTEDWQKWDPETYSVTGPPGGRFVFSVSRLG